MSHVTATVFVGSKSYEWGSDPYKNKWHRTPLHSLWLRAAGISMILSTETSSMSHVTVSVTRKSEWDLKHIKGPKYYVMKLTV